MSEIHYKTGGPLLSTSPDSDIYIEREADSQARLCVQQMEYITLIEPRQQGKTSLINRLMGDFATQGYIFTYVDLTTTNRSSEPAWYASVCGWLLRKLYQSPSFLSFGKSQLPINGYTWLTFLTDLAEHAEQAHINVIIVLDEVGAMPKEWSTDFFSTIRSIYVQRQNFLSLHRISFIIAGAFNPRSLISDPNVSNFNVDKRIDLPDFTIKGVKQLVMRQEFSVRLTNSVASSIYHWTNGQPYLTQCLCQNLTRHKLLRRPEGVPEAISQAVEQFRRSDRHHLARVAEDLKREPASTRNYLQRILLGYHPTFFPAENYIQAQLALIGIIKGGPNGKCIIRNLLYEHALADVLYDLKPVETQQLQDGFRYDVFISYSHNDRDWIHNVLLPHLEQENLRVCIDYRDFEIGIPSLVNMENAVEYSRRTLLILTPHWIANEWMEFESLLIQTKDPTNRGRRILPVMVQPCTLPKRLQIFTYLDLTKPTDFHFQIQRLVSTVQSLPLSLKTIESAPTQRPVQWINITTQSFERGLAKLGESLTQADNEIRLGYALLESRLLTNLQDEQRYGSEEAIRSELAHILEELNRLAITHVGRSFNDLCKASNRISGSSDASSSTDSVWNNIASPNTKSPDEAAEQVQKAPPEP